MNLQPDDPRLSAWLLGELSADDASEVAAAVEADPLLQAEAADLADVANFLGATLAAPGLRAEQRAAVIRAGRTPDGRIYLPANVAAFPVAVPVAPRRTRRWPLVLAAAAAVAIGFFLVNREPEAGEVATVVADPVESPPEEPLSDPRVAPASPASSAMSGSARARLAHGLQQGVESGAFLDPASRSMASQPLPDAWKLPASQGLPTLEDATQVELPLLVGHGSYERVRGWIRDRNELPPRDAVRIEELANAFPLPPEEEIADFAGLRVACLAMSLPWAGHGQLVGVQIANDSGRDRRVEWSFRPAAGSRLGGVRVLASTDGGIGKSVRTLPAGRRTLVLIELPSAGDDAGDLVVASDGRSRRFPAKESPDGALQQAGLVAAFGMWLRGEGIDDRRLTEMLAKAGNVDADADPVRADSRKLMREALRIAARRR